ncbi:MAG: hypothetical protein KKG06_08375 [Bacteroidetes bacterium]|nr:hypothetical protein [Bacteroidota bacterium]MBU1423179.1 hypothetical protein [Bacteroidota bacterium]
MICRYDEAVASAMNALRMSPDGVDINYKVAQMYAIQKNSYEAIEMLTKAVSLHFDLNMILDIDFFNIRTSPEFIDAIKIKQKTE